MTRLPLALLILAALPAAAAAAPFGELPPQTLASPARCLRATGAPGEVVRWAPGGADFLQATAAGFGAPVHIALGERSGECPAAVAQPGGAAVVLARLDDGIGVAVRDPGGAFGPPQTLGAGDASDESPVAAVTPRGDAVLAWTEVSDDSTARLLVARRPAGGAFGAPLELQPPMRTSGIAPPHVSLGIQDDGTVLALWSAEDPDQVLDRDRVYAAVAPPGAPFGARRLLSSRLALESFSVTVAADGRALAFLDERFHTRVLERPPGGSFARIADIGFSEPPLGPPVAALRSGGAAIVAWQEPSDGQVLALRRDAPGPFRSERVGPAPRGAFGTELERAGGGAPIDDEGRDLRAAFAPDGRPLLAWAPAATLGGLTWTGATVATFPGGVQTLSGPARDADSVTPLLLADGTPAVAWSDVAPGGDPLLHLAIEGAPAAPEPPAPRVETGRVRQLHPGFELAFGCSAACDVRGAVGNRFFGRGSLRAAGSGSVRIRPEYSPLLLGRAGTVRVDVVSAAPGAHTAARRTLTVRPRLRATPPLLGLKAVRRGGRIVVRWHTARPLRGVSVFAVSSSTRAPEDPFLGPSVDGDGGRRFQLRVAPDSGDRYIQVSLLYDRDDIQRRIAVLRIGRGA